jgi:hypothetical protein
MKSKPHRKSKNRLINRRGRRRVFILGAGASASCGIAVARQILRKAVERLAKHNSDDADKVLALISYIYPGFNEELSNYPNIEDFLNLVEMAKEFHTEAYIESKKWSQEKLQEVTDITMRGITEYIWDFMAEEGRRGVLSNFVKQLVRKGDVIISFNWDFAIDLVLETLDMGPVYSYRSSPKSVVLLKPHGSIDWFEKGKLAKDKKLINEMRHRAPGVFYYPYFRLARNPDLLKHLLPFIVPPLSIKKFRGFLQRVWRDVYHSVAAAKGLYIIGYSMPREDQFARLVIGRAIERNNSTRKNGQGPLSVTVVNPDETVLGVFGNLAGSGRMRFFHASLEDYVSSLQPEE